MFLVEYWRTPAIANLAAAVPRIVGDTMREILRERDERR